MQTGASTTWNVGDVILDLYKVTDILGEGGFGTVYKVRHQGWNIDLAVKSPKPEIVAAAGGVENFEREAETWVNLGLHPHTVRLVKLPNNASLVSRWNQRSCFTSQSVTEAPLQTPSS